MMSLFEKLLSGAVPYRCPYPLFAYASRAMTETTKTVSAKGRAEYRCRRRIPGGVAIECRLIIQVILVAAWGEGAESRRQTVQLLASARLALETSVGL